MVPMVFLAALRIAVMSDLQAYAQKEDNGMRNLERALDVFAAQKVDVVVNDGDIGDNAVDVSAVAYYKERCDERLGAVPHVACYGNHELNIDLPESLKAVRTPPAVRADFNRVFGFDPTAKLVRQQIRGYDFISYSFDSDAGYTAAEMGELKVALDAAVARDAQKPIFVVTHYHPEGTVNASEPKGGELRKLLNDYPQVVSISGHSHYPLQAPGTIWQGEFTAIESASLCYGAVRAVPQSVNQISRLLPYGHDAVYCQMLEVCDDEIVLRRYTVRDGQEIEPDNPRRWTIPYDPKKPKYSPAAQAALEVAPEFGGDPEPTVWYDYGFTYLLFLPVKDKERVFRYEIAVAERGGASKTFSFLSDFYRPSGNRANRVCVRCPTGTFEYGKTYDCTVTPVGFYGKRGCPCKWTTKTEILFPFRDIRQNVMQE